MGLLAKMLHGAKSPKQNLAPGRLFLWTDAKYNIRCRNVSLKQDGQNAHNSVVNG